MADARSRWGGGRGGGGGGGGGGTKRRWTMDDRLSVQTARADSFSFSLSLSAVPLLLWHVTRVWIDRGPWLAPACCCLPRSSSCLPC
ncbi:hypothetical protein DAEQUDRAFT_494647 [Daedalea quercina L-15889]|uniref:Uncharacterized protein n=1 Tax=Daedalea quercina L-15889 TaxID=1314783 RepID=A0A165MNE8_9APHY|nr:hypothetical protein DAEQUDRAFT_494647 [Daedalea quercina L-15889]